MSSHLPFCSLVAWFSLFIWPSASFLLSTSLLTFSSRYANLLSLSFSSCVDATTDGELWFDVSLKTPRDVPSSGKICGRVDEVFLVESTGVPPWPEVRESEGGEKVDFWEDETARGRDDWRGLVEAEVLVDEVVLVEKVAAERRVEVVEEEAVVGGEVRTVFPPDPRSDSPEWDECTLTNVPPSLLAVGVLKNSGDEPILRSSALSEGRDSAGARVCELESFATETDDAPEWWTFLVASSPLPDEKMAPTCTATCLLSTRLPTTTFPSSSVSIF